MAVHDRVNTTWTAWQATTFGCAQCHAHPYDPIPQRDYYRFAAFSTTPRTATRMTISRACCSRRMRRDGTPSLSSSFWIRALRESINQRGLATLAEVRDWRPWIPTEAKASGGTRPSPPMDAFAAAAPADQGGLHPDAAGSAGDDGIQGGVVSGPGDPKSAPERGQIFSSLQARLIPPGKESVQPPGGPPGTDRGPTCRTL